VTALHNHWLFDNPNLWYIHFEKVEKPLVFATEVEKIRLSGSLAFIDSLFLFNHRTYRLRCQDIKRVTY
jgi:hypothetical protein